MQLVQVPVEGGSLATAVWEGEGPLVVAAHGITASHLSWSMVADALDGSVRFVAPDLRGRGASNSLPGPYGMDAHARDLVAVLDHFGVESALVVGQSMGGYAAVEMAASFPERVARVLMVDGGLPLPIPEGLTLDQIVDAVIGPARARLSMEFESREAHRDFWRSHPALSEWWGPKVEAYVDYDLVGEAPSLRSRVSLDAVMGDSEFNVRRESRLPSVTAPVELLRAERGMLNQVPPLFPDELVAPWRGTVVDLGVVPDTNHYTIIMSAPGAAAVAEAIKKACAARPA